MIRYTTILYYKHEYIVSEKDLQTVDLYAHTQLNNRLCPTSPLCADAWAEILNLLTWLFCPLTISALPTVASNKNAKFKGAGEHICGLVWSNGGSMVKGEVERQSGSGQTFMYLLTLFFVFLRLWTLLDSSSCSEVDSLEMDRGVANSIPALKTIIQWRQTNVTVWKSSVEDSGPFFSFSTCFYYLSYQCDILLLCSC